MTPEHERIEVSGPHATETVIGWYKVALRRIDQLERENNRYRLMLEDFAAKGCRHDIDRDTSSFEGRQWISYLRSMDASVKERASNTLKVR